jgi:hypothetical protein
MTLVSDYPYLMFSLIMLLGLGAGAVFIPAQRAAMLVSGLLSAPYAFASVLFVPEYWQPKRVACFLTGPEDLIFSFAGGGLIWLTAICLVRPGTEVSMHPGRVVRRYLGWTVPFFSLVVALKYVFGFSTMTSVLMSGSAHYAVLLWMRRDLFRFSLLTGVGYCVMYTAFCVFAFAVCPHFLEQWNRESLTGLTIVGVPIEESLWALVFSASWALAIGYAFAARLPEDARAA